MEYSLRSEKKYRYMYRVLIADDEKIEREGIKFLLSMEEGEYEIQEASNGKQALGILYTVKK